MSCSVKKGAGGFGDGFALTDVRGCRALVKIVRWQTSSPSCSSAAKVGPAGRRLQALFTGWLSRSLIQRGQGPFEVHRWRDGRRLVLYQNDLGRTGAGGSG